MERVRDLLKAYLKSKLEPATPRPWTEIKEGMSFGLVITLCFLTALVGLVKIYTSEQIQPAHVSLVSAGILLAGVFIALGNLRNARLERASRTYHEEAKALYEAAYDALKIDPETSFPLNSRQNYINCARLLQSAQHLQSMIPFKADRDASREIEQLWRFKFNELLLSRSQSDLGRKKGEQDHNHPWCNPYYFFQKGRLLASTKEDRSPIDRSSLAVILRFMKWPEHLKNRLGEVTPLNSKEVETMWFDPVSGLEGYLRRCEDPTLFQDTRVKPKDMFKDNANQNYN